MQHKTVISPLKWFFSLINAELSKLTWTDRWKFFLDMAEAFHVALDRSDFEPYVNPEWDPKLLVEGTDALANLQQKFRTILSELKGKIDNIESAEASHQSDYVSPKKYLEMTRLQAVPLTIQMSLSIEPSVLPEFALNPKHLEKTALVHWAPSSFSTGHLDVKVSSKSFEALMTYHFFQALRDLPLQSVGQCHHCEKWFVSTNLRSQRFCSSRCATRKANKDRYDRKKRESPAQYAEELEQGKARAKKSYEQKIRQTIVYKDGESKKITNGEGERV